MGIKKGYIYNVQIEKKKKMIRKGKKKLWSTVCLKQEQQVCVDVFL